MLNDGSKKEWLIVLVKLDNLLICDCFDIPLHKLRRLVTIVELNATFYYRKLNIQTVFFSFLKMFFYIYSRLTHIGTCFTVILTKRLVPLLCFFFHEFLLFLVYFIQFILSNNCDERTKRTRT